MASLPVPESRRCKRVLAKQRASVVINLDRDQKRLPCLVLDCSRDGFRLRGGFHLRRGQTVEIVLDEDPVNAVRCSVVWVGKVGSKQEGEVGVQALRKKFVVK
jgi:PilZ domain